MPIESIAPIDTSLLGNELQISSEASIGEDFSKFIEQSIVDINNNINQTEELVRELAVGETNNLHQVLLQIEKTKMSFQLALQVRSKLLEGYQEIMRMQI